MLFRRWAKKRQAETGQIYPVFTIGTAAILGLPVIAFFLAGMPALLDQPALATFNIRGGMVLKPEFTAPWFALLVYQSSFINAIVRAGIQARSHQRRVGQEGGGTFGSGGSRVRITQNIQH